MIAACTVTDGEAMLVLIALAECFICALVFGFLVHHWRAKARKLQAELSAMQSAERCKPLPATDVQRQNGTHGRNEQQQETRGEPEKATDGREQM